MWSCVKNDDIKLTVNGEAWEVRVANNTTLLQVLREDLNLTGSKEGCDDSSCGACTVIINGSPALACITLAVDCNGSEVLNVEGLNEKGELHPLQKSFIEKDAVQCGFCTPGMLVGAKHLLDNNPAPSAEDVRERLTGHVCRCTGYVKVIEAVLDGAAQTRRKQL
ncbi:MAG: (2Fe-2S)-binding protein [Thermincola sp.]|nr:(2Fe-2S)-binding protein [Thermincola sp.]MDT3703225.1 (2Fe-2S)-binding protein [Thermincola sp.]